jgi:ABC-type multidrug transport system ATPase subunit
MRTEGPAFTPSPLTVWVGPTRYVFAPGRDVVVGYGPGCDIPLERLGNPAAPPPAPRAVALLRFTGSQWVAIDSSPDGIFLDGSRVPTVKIRNGQAISIGDPYRGLRLVFQLGAATGPHRQPPVPPHRPAYPPPRPPQAPHPPPPPQQQSLPQPQPQPPRFRRPPVQPPQFPLPPPPAPQSGRPNPPDLRAPTERATQQLRIAPPPQTERAVGPTSSGPAPASARSSSPSTPLPDQPSGAVEVEQEGRGLIERMVTRKLRVPRPSLRTEEGSSTYRLPLQPGARTTGVSAYQLGLTAGGHEILAGISFTARPGTLTAVIGPSTPRNSALLELLTGGRELTSGQVTIDGHDVHAEPDSMRTRVGMVTRDECLHPQLTVERVLGYAAELRLPPDTPAEHRDRMVNQVLDELDLREHRATRICKLPPEVRRCASLAVELVTRPTLLTVDQPGAGLDAAQENHVMAILRRQADLGCVVVVALSSQSSEASLSNLSLCDQVTVLTAAGTVAFLGAPLQIESSMGGADFAEVLARVNAEPVGFHRAYPSGQQVSALAAPPEAAAPWPSPARLPVCRQIRMLTGRQIRLLFVDHVYFLFWAVLPLVLAALVVLIPGESGLDRPPPVNGNPHETIEILAALNMAAVILGTGLTIRVVVAERRVFRREQAVGLSASGYLAAKVIVFSGAAAILTAIVFVIVVAVKGGPVHGAVLLHDPALELYVSVSVTAIVSAIVGLALSTLGRSLREVLPLLVPVILASLVFDGSLVPLVSRWGLQQISWFVPAQWGFAASASTVDLRRVDPLAANAEMWTHYSGWWVFDMIMLLVLGGVAAGFALYRLRPTVPKH